jgi:hypothetical protein
MIRLVDSSSVEDLSLVQCEYCTVPLYDFGALVLQNSTTQYLQLFTTSTAWDNKGYSSTVSNLALDFGWKEGSYVRFVSFRFVQP